ncbi:hypothetical protein FOL47_008619 [Perkinsus chesapeaki]|uniref:Integrase catalytic domain-containing protein n=1 Tax=Perkinsus chesapeaki TaxID=330153 RepID=A0A7J6LCZ0_PERCH|nr:hypothetical protein FOL47_008619 [Perkinsus chesapeaki]
MLTEISIIGTNDFQHLLTPISEIGLHKSQLADAEVAVAEAERAVDDQLLVDVQRRLPAPTLLTSGLAQQDPVGHPDVTASPVASLQGRRQAATPRSAGLSSNTAQSNDSVSKVLIPKLADPYNFVNHLNMFCRIMVDHGHGRFVDGAFVPSGQETSLVVKLVKSVDKCASLHQAAESAAQTSTYQWGPTEEDFVDRCFTLEEEPEDASQGHQPQTESYLVRRLGSDTWSIDQACRSISVLRWCLDAWLVAARDKTRRGPRSKDFQPFPRNWTREDLLVLLRADQGGNSAVCSLREKGFSEPYYDIDGLVTFRSSLSSGAVAFRPLVSSLIRDKLLRDVHRSHGHCGVDYMCGRVTQGFHAQRLRSAAALIKQHCVFCARFCASFPKTWTVPCGGPFFDLESLMALPAYSVVGIDFLSLAPKVKVLAVVCAATRHCSLFYTPQENSHCSLAAIKELCLLFGRPLCVYSDRASYFRSSYFLEGLEKMGIQNVHLASRSPFEGSLYERRNQEVRRLLRFFEELPVVRRLLAHFDASSVSDVTSLRRLLMEISLIMNQRPLGISRSGEDVNTICPDSLCFGYTRRTDQLSEPLFEVPNRPSVVDEGVPQAGVDMVIDSAAVRRGSTGYLPLGAQGSPPQRFSAVRNSFLSYHFQWLRDRSTRNVVRGVAKAGNVSIHFDEGDLVFVKSGKVIYPARVVQTLPGSDGVVRRLRVRNSKSGHESTVSHHNVVKSSIESSLQD